VTRTLRCGLQASLVQDEIMSCPGVSVLLPTISVGPWLDEAVRSVLQSACQNLEVIIVLDGVEFSETYDWKSDPRVRCIRLPARGGLPHALNVAAQIAVYPFLARLDADDRVAVDRLRRQAGYLLKNSAVVILGSTARRIDETGRVTGTIGVAADGDLRSSLLRRNVLLHSSVMMRAERFAEVGGYDESLEQMEDYDLWLRMAVQGEVHILSDALVDYRVHAGQMSRGAKPFGRYISRVLQGRRSLGTHLQEGSMKQVAWDAAWLVAQWLRYFRLRKPGYAR